MHVVYFTIGLKYKIKFRKPIMSIVNNSYATDFDNMTT